MLLFSKSKPAEPAFGTFTVKQTRKAKSVAGVRTPSLGGRRNLPHGYNTFGNCTRTGRAAGHAADRNRAANLTRLILNWHSMDYFGSRGLRRPWNSVSAGEAQESGPVATQAGSCAAAASSKTVAGLLQMAEVNYGASYDHHAKTNCQTGPSGKHCGSDRRLVELVERRARLVLAGRQAADNGRKMVISRSVRNMAAQQFATATAHRPSCPAAPRGWQPFGA